MPANTLNRATPPPIHDAIEFQYNLPPISTVKLDNGLPLYWLAAGVQDVVEVDFIFPAGEWQEPKPSVAQATAALLKSGTASRTAHQISEAVEFYGATLKVSAGPDFAAITLYALTKDLPQLLPIIREIMTEAVFPESELAIYKQNTIQRLLVSLRQCEFVANQRIDALLFGEAHPYGRFTRQEKIEAVTREDIERFYRHHYHPGRAKIFMAGNVGAEQAALINQIFGADQHADAADVEARTFSAPAPSAHAHHIINDENGVQAAIRIGRLVPNRHHPDFPKMVVLNTLFGGYFGSRLMSNIREDKGYTYGIYSSLQSLEHGGSLIIHSEVGAKVAEAAIAEVYKEMQELCDAPAPEEELLLVKNFLLGGLLGDLDGPFQVLARWRTLIMNGLDAAHFTRNIDVYKRVTAEELQALAKQYYAPGSFYEVSVI